MNPFSVKMDHFSVIMHVTLPLRTQNSNIIQAVLSNPPLGSVRERAMDATEFT